MTEKPKRQHRTYEIDVADLERLQTAADLLSEPGTGNKSFLLRQFLREGLDRFDFEQEHLHQCLKCNNYFDDPDDLDNNGLCEECRKQEGKV